jgi:YHS domain-containing protein
MNRPLSIILLALALAAGCSRKAQTVEAPPPTSTDMRTIDSANLRPAPIEAPPVLTDEAPPLKQLNIVAQTDAPPPPTPQDEALRASLPFAPAIAMDPVDGSKISIRVSIPTLEYKNKLYYFATDEHKRAFLANPEQYTKGVFSHL